MKRVLGKSGIEVSAVRMGCWAIGGVWTFDGASAGWSTDRTDAAAAFSDGPGCAAAKQQLNVFDGNMELLTLCEELGLAGINRAPLGMGILTGKFTRATEFSGDDVRSARR